jgi:hypothetical protein
VFAACKHPCPGTAARASAVSEVKQLAIIRSSTLTDSSVFIDGFVTRLFTVKDTNRMSKRFSRDPKGCVSAKPSIRAYSRGPHFALGRLVVGRGLQHRSPPARPHGFLA